MQPLFYNLLVVTTLLLVHYSVSAAGPPFGGPFEVRAYQYDVVTGVNVTGYWLTGDADLGFLLLTPTKQNPVVIRVDGESHAHVVRRLSKSLSTLTFPVPILIPSANFVNFLHLDSTTGSENPGFKYKTPPSSIFQWIGSLNHGWYACPLPQQEGYGLYKQMVTWGPSPFRGWPLVDLASVYVDLSAESK